MYIYAYNFVYVHVCVCVPLCLSLSLFLAFVVAFFLFFRESLLLSRDGTRCDLFVEWRLSSCASAHAQQQGERKEKKESQP
jgi:hypothetical protein